MLTYEDCLAFCDLTEDEIEAIAEHEHIPAIVAMELGQYLVQSEDGVRKIKRIILDDIQVAQQPNQQQQPNRQQGGLVALAAAANELPGIQIDDLSPEAQERNKQLTGEVDEEMEAELEELQRQHRPHGNNLHHRARRVDEGANINDGRRALADFYHDLLQD